MGCVNKDDTSSDSEDDSFSFDPYEKILGVWMSQGDEDGRTYVIVYEFFSNSSYFTGVFDMNTSSYMYSLWGMYDLDNETIFFYGASGTNITSSLDYAFSTDYKKIVLYFSDEQFLIFSKAELD